MDDKTVQTILAAVNALLEQTRKDIEIDQDENGRNMEYLSGRAYAYGLIIDMLEAMNG